MYRLSFHYFSTSRHCDECAEIAVERMTETMDAYQWEHVQLLLDQCEVLTDDTRKHPTIVE